MPYNKLAISPQKSVYREQMSLNLCICEVTVKVTDTPATYSVGHVGLAALEMVQPWAELDVAGVGFSFANWMAAVIAPYIIFVLMLDLLHFVFRSRVDCLWIGPRLALAARCG